LGGLRPEVRAADENRLDAVADPVFDPGQIPQRDLGLPLEDPVDIRPPGEDRDVPFFDVADAARPFEKGRRDEGCR
jgi:hypothetical protein